MDYIYIGDIVNTHGIKGEVRIMSNFERKNLIFKQNFPIYIGNNKEKQIINTYRVHKNFDMLTFNDICDINDVLLYKGEKVYILRSDLDENFHIKNDLIGFDVICNDNNVGKVAYFFNNNAYDLMVIKNSLKSNIVPYLSQFIDKIDYDKKMIYICNMEGLIDEN